MNICYIRIKLGFFIIAEIYNYFLRSTILCWTKSSYNGYHNVQGRLLFCSHLLCVLSVYSKVMVCLNYKGSLCSTKSLNWHPVISWCYFSFFYRVQIIFLIRQWQLKVQGHLSKYLFRALSFWVVTKTPPSTLGFRFSYAIPWSGDVDVNETEFPVTKNFTS